MRRPHTVLAVVALLSCGSAAYAAEDHEERSNNVAITGVEVSTRIALGRHWTNGPQASPVEPEDRAAELSRERKNRKVRIVYPFGAQVCRLGNTSWAADDGEAKCRAALDEGLPRSGSRSSLRPHSE